jgi:hypothetical protein
MWKLVTLTPFVLTGLTVPHQPAATAQAIPKEVKALEGNYAGEWSMHGINDKGAVVKLFSWTDTVKTTGAAVKGDRAFITWVNEQVFEGGKIPPRKMEGKEGYLLNKDGSVGDYFIEMFGQVTRLARLSETAWASASPASPQELSAIGFPQGAAGQNVMVKVVGKEQGVETHRVSVLSTVTWTDKSGKQQVLQFVSLQGFHKRQP